MVYSPLAFSFRFPFAATEEVVACDLERGTSDSSEESSNSVRSDSSKSRGAIVRHVQKAVNDV